MSSLTTSTNINEAATSIVTNTNTHSDGDHDDSLLVDYDPIEPPSSFTNKDAPIVVKGDLKSVKRAPSIDSNGSSSVNTNGYAVMDVSFRDLCLRPELIRAITQAGYEHPAQVQAQCLPQAILGTDLIVQSASGSGKTAVFVIATLQQLPTVITRGMTDTVVLAHTREMAHQIALEFGRFGRYIDGFTYGEFYGGVSESVNRASLKNAIDRPTVAIGTPGRLLKLIKIGLLPVTTVRRLIMDECDLLLASSVAMRADCQAIFKAMQREKQVMMFSATMSADTKVLIRKFVVSPLEVMVNDERALSLNRLLQYYVSVTDSGKNRLLFKLLDALEFNQVVIFVTSASRAIALCALLRESSFPAECVHGSMPQVDRLRIYDRVREGKARIMVSTDLFARGVDFQSVNISINYDMPLMHDGGHGHNGSDGKKETKADDAKALTKSNSKVTSSKSNSNMVTASDTYLHRVGRSGRFGTRGLAISMISSSSDAAILEMVQSRFEVEIAALPDTIDTSSYM